MMYHWLNYTKTTKISQLQKIHGIVAQQPEFDFVVALARDHSNPNLRMTMHLMQLPTEIRNYIMSIQIILGPGDYVYIPNKGSSNYWTLKVM